MKDEELQKLKDTIFKLKVAVGELRLQYKIDTGKNVMEDNSQSMDYFRMYYEDNNLIILDINDNKGFIVTRLEMVEMRKKVLQRALDELEGHKAMVNK